MNFELLEEAADALRRASEEAESESIQDRLTDRADGLSAIADEERTPDHGRLAREDATLREITSDADAEAVGEHVETAREKIAEFREDVEGV